MLLFSYSLIPKDPAGSVSCHLPGGAEGSTGSTCSSWFRRGQRLDDVPLACEFFFFLNATPRVFFFFFIFTEVPHTTTFFFIFWGGGGMLTVLPLEKINRKLSWI